MGNVKFPGFGSKAWVSLINEHARAGAIREQQMPSVTRLLEELEVPGTFWELVSVTRGTSCMPPD